MRKDNWKELLMGSILKQEDIPEGVPISAKIGFGFGKMLTYAGAGIGHLVSKVPILNDFQDGMVIAITTIPISIKVRELNTKIKTAFDTSVDAMASAIKSEKQI